MGSRVLNAHLPRVCPHSNVLVHRSVACMTANAGKVFRERSLRLALQMPPERIGSAAMPGSRLVQTVGKTIMVDVRHGDTCCIVLKEQVEQSCYEQRSSEQSCPPKSRAPMRVDCSPPPSHPRAGRRKTRRGTVQSQ